MDHRIDAIYGRQSIDKKDSISIESQFEFCWYELKGGEGKEYKDKGYSGKNIDRPDFQRLLADIKAGLIKRVVVYKLDRISRSIVDFAKLMEIFKQYNVEFVSCTEKFDTSTPMGRAAYGFDLEPIVMDGIKTKKLVKNAEMDYVSSSQVESISGYLRDWESVDFDDKRRVLDTLVSQVRATSEQVVIHWKL